MRYKPTPKKIYLVLIFNPPAKNPVRDEIMVEIDRMKNTPPTWWCGFLEGGLHRRELWNCPSVIFFLSLIRQRSDKVEKETKNLAKRSHD